MSNPSHIRYLIETGMIIAFYLIAARLGRLSILHPDEVTAWRPAAGITIAAAVIL
jgi:hypothetical protein